MSDVEKRFLALYQALRTNNSHYIDRYKISGQNIMIPCPFHKDGRERKPSAGISLKTGAFHCFTCQKTASLNEVIEKCLGENIDLDLDISNERSIQLFNESKEEKHSHIDLTPYRKIHSYILDRGISKKVCQFFEVGYDDKSDCVVFPVKDYLGQVLFLAKRSVNTKYFSIPKDAKFPLYGEYEVRKIAQTKSIDEIYLCESIIDALTLWTWGKFAVAFMGLGSYNQYKRLDQLPSRTLVLATDEDERGLKARERIKPYIHTKLVYELKDYSEHKDINEMNEQEFLRCQKVFVS